MIRRHASGGNPHQSLHFFRNLQWSGNGKMPSFIPDHFTFASAVKACGRLMAIREGKSIHCQVLRRALESNPNVQNTLIHFYSSSGDSIGSACHLFDGIPCRTTVTINCMLSGLLKNRFFWMGLSLFNKVLDGCLGEELSPNDVTLMILIGGCAEYGNLSMGRTLHAFCCKSFGCSMILVGNALIDMYASFGCIEDAEDLFHEMPERDLVSWNSLIAGYRKNDEADKAISLFEEMRSRGVDGDRVTLVSLISACARSKNLEMGDWIHANLRRRANNIPIPIATALINMYSKCGKIEIARKIFNKMPTRNIVSWNSIILGYVENGLSNEAVSLFERIQVEKLIPDEVTMLGVISACQNLKAFDHGDRILSYIQHRGLAGSTVLCNALIDMYAKFGCMDRAKRIFGMMPKRDVISWTSVIVGYAINGRGMEALEVFCQMLDARAEPNSITFIGVLSACDHNGLVDDGINMYRIMCQDYSLKPEIEHCGCMVDMFARAGLLKEADDFVRNMPIEPNAVIWRMLIGACRVHGEVGLGASLVDRMIGLKMFCDPEDYVISSNTFAESGRWDDVLLARRLIGTQAFLRMPGISSVTGVTE
ncbi:pentatricopeptide repeat-containing protein DOT4, chloroplastic-like [Cocos nucifera]|uniref:Pentatricopeptide repeat-containing protein DOT4, chloroplastic-like n=1 Tax=Cocos nucifera TaxID=13894 RepID=A0A8K0I2S0_COCNU|nr:pentatricopeptide repeat-containing protein DOT4, chloroplastic-like [Cocos nucifera]